MRAMMSAHRRALCKISDRNRNSSAERCKILAMANRRAANHLALIRSFLIDSGHSRASREANCAKFFCAAFASHRVNSGAKFCAHARDSNCRTALTAHQRRCKKPLFHRCFCNMRAMYAQCRSAFVYYDVACAVCVVECALHAQRASHTHVVKWSHVFFHRSVVNGVQCVSIPDRTELRHPP